MDEVTQKLVSLVNSFAKTHQYSEDIYWLASADFTRCLHVTPSYEKMLGHPRKFIYKNIKIWDTYIVPIDLANHHPFIEMGKRIKQEGTEARYSETYRMIRRDGQIRSVLDRGHPVSDEHGQCIGVMGVAIDTTDTQIIHQLPIQSWSEFPKSDCSRYYLRGRYQKIYLTPREASCAFYLLQGKTAKQTAKILNLSHRTIEDVLDRIKNKFGLCYRADLFNALLDGDFIRTLQNGF